MRTAYISLVLETNCTPLPQQQKGLTWSQCSTWKPYSILIHKFNMIIWSIIYFISILLIFPASFRLNCHFKFEKQALFGCHVIILVKKIGWYQDGQFKANLHSKHEINNSFANQLWWEIACKFACCNTTTHANCFKAWFLNQHSMILILYCIHVLCIIGSSYQTWK